MPSTSAAPCACSNARGQARFNSRTRIFPNAAATPTARSSPPRPRWPAKSRRRSMRGARETLVIARTDAIAVEGFERAIERAALYRDAGADVLFVEAPKTRAELKRIP